MALVLLGAEHFVPAVAVAGGLSEPLVERCLGAVEPRRVVRVREDLADEFHASGLPVLEARLDERLLERRRERRGPVERRDQLVEARQSRPSPQVTTSEIPTSDTSRKAPAGR